MREFRAGDGAALRAFWEASGSSQGENPLQPPGRSLAAFADRNPGLFLLAQDERGLAATALGGWDGRRGWLYHVAVRPDQRRHGLGGRPVRIIEERLKGRDCRGLLRRARSAHAKQMGAAKPRDYQRATTVEFEKQL